MEQLTLRIRQGKDGGLYATYRGAKNSRNTGRLLELGLKIPSKRYRVRFRQAKNGALRVGPFINHLRHFDMEDCMASYCVCFLRVTGWPIGTRVSRQVLPWR